MSKDIESINLPLPYRLGTVNCYLVRADAGFVLIDTGCGNRVSMLEKALEGAGCLPGNLRAVVLTHGDFDHSGNAAYLRQKYGTIVAMHRDDAGMVERGDIFWNRKSGNILFRKGASVLFKFSQSQRFTPERYVEDGQSLAEYGWDARVVHLPGHSKGSIGVLTAAGNLFCGDLLENGKRPKLNSIVDDPVAVNTSLDKLVNLGAVTVYPGHGGPFTMEEFLDHKR